MTHSRLSSLEMKYKCDFQPLKGVQSIQTLWENQLGGSDRYRQLSLCFIKIDNKDSFYSYWSGVECQGKLIFR